MSNHLKQIIITVCLSVIAGFLAASQFQVLQETPEYIRVKFTLPEWKLESTTANSKQWKKIVCDAGSNFSKDGYPLLKSFSEAVGIPVDGDISIEVISQKQETIANVQLLPADKMTLDGMDVSYSFFQDLKAYRSKELYPVEFAKKGIQAYVGNRNMIPVQLYPFQYRALKNELLVTREAELIIHISGNKAPSRNWQTASSYIDKAGSSFFLNNRTSQTWRKAKETSDYVPPSRTNTNLVNEIQLIVDQEGIYKITYAYLQAKMNRAADSLGIQYAWSPATVDPRHLQLNDENGAVAIHFSGESDGVFNENDYFEFYGDRHYGDTSYQDDYTAENVYVLSLTESLGARLAVENGGLTVSSPPNPPDAFQQTIHLEQQVIPDKLGRSWDYNHDYYREDTWFWRKITAPNLDIIPFELQYPKDTTIRTLSTKMSLFGLTYMDGLPFGAYDHKATVRLNQAFINTKSWRDQSEQIFTNEVPIPNSYLQNGTNYFYISMNGDTPMGDREQVLLDYIELTYWREYKTDEDFIRFTKPSNKPFGLFQFKVEGFSSNQVSIYKIGSSVINNMQIEPFTLNGGAPWTVTFQDSVISNDVKYFAVTENLKKQPKDFRINVKSYLHSPDNSADCLIITNRQFAGNEGTLLYKQLWENKGFVVNIVDIQDIYDEFNFGIKSATALKDFITYAYNNWSAPQLRSIVLLGDGTDDERDFSASRKYNIIPVKKVWTNKHGATASDNWYGCVVGSDPLPDISVTRINVWKPEQIIQVAQKSQIYLTQPNFNKLWHGQIILASGGKASDPNDVFSQQSEFIRRYTIPKYYRTSRVYTSTQSVSSDYFGGTASLISKINDGAIYLQFMGHGGGRIWADYNLFNFNNVSSLNNQNYPIVSSLACYCSAFDTNGSSSISEALILEPGKGAIATIGFAGLGYLYDDIEFATALNEGLFVQGFDNLGDAVNFTKAKFFVSTSNPESQQALTYGCAVLGDANIPVIKPLNNLVVNTSKDNFSIGDTLRVMATFPQNAIAARTYVMKPNEMPTNTPYDLPVTQGNYNFSTIVTGNTLDTYQRKIFVAGYSDQAEYVGSKEISVGRGLIAHLNTIPASPAWNDSIKFTAKITGIQGITSLICKVRLDSTNIHHDWLEIPMSVSATDATIYQSISALSPQTTGKEFYIKYRATTSNRATVESMVYSITVAGPELLMSDMQFIPQNQELRVKVLIKNIGNAPAPQTELNLYAIQTGHPNVLLENRTFAPLNINEQRWETISIDTLITNNVVLQADVNIPRMFPEWSYDNDNNSLQLAVPMNYHTVTSAGGIFSSLDTNLTCEVPQNLVPLNQTALFYINNLAPVIARDEPDVYTIKLRSGVSSPPFEVKTLSENIVDSTGVLIGGQMIKLTFFYSPTDSLNILHENEDTFKVYRWEPTFRKWILQGGNVSVTENKVILEVNRQGIFTLLRNQDRTLPSIDVNVQDQEFTVGGFISGKGTISLILSDANGIDVFDNSIKLYIDGVLVPENQWIKTVNQDDINRIPIKFPLNLQKGDYTLVVDCKDVNGNFKTRHIQFIVNDKFDIIRLANYPNPVLGFTQDPKNAGRTRFTYVLTDDADDVTIKVFTVSGRLVRTFRNLPAGVGYHEFPRTVYAWDCTDEQGFFLANGVYFYRIIAKKGNKSIEKIQKMAIIK